ncbi:Ff.00g035720.m01.CDS01 [Fusarium sp. VM40]|nr:Ff.00g035720.m01.CDS01 [Fusarium sp. VM40]
MSGAEAALLGVGILCNAMQIITFAKDSLHVYRNIRDGRSPDPNLDLYLKNAKAAFDEMNQSATQMGPLNKTHQQIVDVGKNVHDCVDELQQKFAKLHVDNASKRGVRGRVAASKKSIATLWHGKELEDAEKNLQRHERLLHSLVLDRVCSQSQAAEITTLRSFQRLEDGFQNIISQLVNGSTKVSDLATEFSSNSDRLVKEHATTRTVIEDHVASEGKTIRLSISQSISQFREELLRREQEKAFEKQREKQHEQLLSSLRFPEMNSRKNQITNNYPGTFDWIFKTHPLSPEPAQSEDGSQLSGDTEEDDPDGCDSDESNSHECGYIDFAETIELSGFDSFPSWLESNANLFWVSGKPASGKSSLMKFLAFNQQTVNHLNKWQSHVRILTHFFWKPGQLLERSVQGMALSLLYQVLDGQPDLSRRLWETQPFIRQKRNSSDWSLDDISEALVVALKASTELFCIFLDGLDEAKDLEHLPWPDWTDSQVIHKLLEVKNVKLCASSREEHAFCSFFESASRLRIHQLNNHDITHFVRERLDICGLDCRDRDYLVAKVVQRAEGVFLWVILVVDSLNRAIRQSYTTFEMLEERLAHTPSDLTKLYVDMWGRIGDDAQLPSIRAIASRYFNLVIVTRKMNDYRWNSDQERSSILNCMSSLLVMATAIEDMSMKSILSKGRVITAEELSARCAKVEGEVRLVCRGLLEVTNPGQESKYVEWNGDQRLCDSNSRKVDFIHRSAFDFLMDTEHGLQCLRVCGLSESELVSRILAAHLIRSRFLCVNTLSLDCQPSTIWHKVRYRAGRTNPYLRMALVIVFDNRLAIERPLRTGLLNIVKEWQLSGSFGGQSHWAIPKSLHHTMSLLELEFIETGIYAAFINGFYGLSGIYNINTTSDDAIINAKTLLDNYPADRLLNAIPFVLRALSSIESDHLGIRYPSELLKYVLYSLQCMTSEKGESPDLMRNTIRGLHSWYIVHCLVSLLAGRWKPNPAGIPDMELVSQLSNTLHSEDEWHHEVLLEFQAFDDLDFTLIEHPYFTFTHGHYALVVGTFATVYRLLDKAMFNRLSQGLGSEVPHTSASQFEPIIIADLVAYR